MNICQALLSTPDQLKDLSTWADEIGTSSRTLMRMFQKENGAVLSRMGSANAYCPCLK